MKKHFLPYLLCLMLPALSHARSSDGWTLDDCMEYAVENNFKKRQQEYTQDNYRQNHRSNVAGLLPTVSPSASTRWSFGRSVDPTDNTYTATSNFQNSLGLSSSMTLFNGLVQINNIRSSGIAMERGKEEMKKIVDEICLDIIGAFFQVVYYQESVAISVQQLEQSRNDYRRTEKYVELGMKSFPDLTQITAQVASAEYTLTRQENLLEKAVLNLKSLMNYPIEEPIDIVPPSETELYSDRYYDREQLMESVMRLPSVKIADYTLRESRLSYSIAKGQQYPSLSASGSYSSSYHRNLQSSSAISYHRQLKNNESKYISLSLSIPIFNGLARRSNINRSRNALRIRELENEQTHRNILIEAQQAIMDFEAYFKETLQSEKQMLSYEQSHKVNQNKFDQGMISALELETSANQLLSAKADFLNSRLQLILKKRLLDYYSGEPLLKTRYE